jgi:hypothetical protein
VFKRNAGLGFAATAFDLQPAVAHLSHALPKPTEPK